ncbi:MAG: methionyl aminopeptidase [Phycisphaerales bacterium]|nr:methionyl aminopeptidase [Phycisphaerales bacterium]
MIAPGSGSVIALKTADDLAAMRIAGRAVWHAVSAAVGRCAPGMTTAEVAGAALAAADGLEAAIISVCVNDQAAFAPPGPRRLCAGDLVTVDVAGAVGGWWSDAARVAVVAPPGEDALRLAQAADATLAAGLAAIRPEVAWSAVAAAVRAEAGRRGVGLVVSLAGHGIGRRPHEGPALRLDATAGGPGDLVLRAGMVVTLEPTVTLGNGATVEAPDGTVRTADGGLVCTEERTLAVPAVGTEVLTGA